ncbi:MAG TPA: hypothetical protein VIC35_05805 [Acidimicrobiia bacterium]
MTSPRSRWIVGALLGVTYALVLVWTVGAHARHVRPLYDGFAPTEQYRWVDPPAFFASGNKTPAGVTSTVELTRAGSRPAGIATSDAQLVLDLGTGAVATHGRDTKVRITITPVSAAGLERVPSGLRANGNAYRVSATYEPSHVPVRQPFVRSTMLLTVPEVGTQLFTARATGRGWTPIPSDALPPSNLSVSANLAAPGYYLDATRLPSLVGPGQSSSTSLALPIAIGIGGLVLVLVGAGLLLARRRRRQPVVR